jgi:hypothetical protein
MGRWIYRVPIKTEPGKTPASLDHCYWSDILITNIDEQDA